jgi:hypothetical protein
MFEGKKILLFKGLSQKNAEQHVEKAFHGLQALDNLERYCRVIGVLTFIEQT